MQHHSKIYIAGYPGLMGTALEHELKAQGFCKILTPTFAEVDLRDKAAVFAYFEKELPEYVFLTAAKVGGILDYLAFPVDFIQDNLMIVSNVAAAAHHYQVKKLLYFSSACVYSHHLEQPIAEDQLGIFALDPESEYYALPKLAGIRICQAYQKQYGSKFISCIPVNLYGPERMMTGNGVGIALIRRLCDAVRMGDTTFTVWGSGNQRREFLYSQDAAAAALFLMQKYEGVEPINLGWGSDISIGEFAALVAHLIGFKGTLVFDTSKPEGALQKLLDSSRLKALGFEPKVRLEEGILRIAQAYQEQYRDTNLNKDKTVWKTASL